MSRISDRIRYIGVNDHNKELFEGLWPLPYGISYNSYIVTDEKTALIDTVGKGFEIEFLENIRKEIGSKPVDYLIINHMEPDHSSLISLIKEVYPGILIVTNAKAVPMLKGYYGISEDEILTVRDGDKLRLGSCSLTFFLTPMVHWPETMMTWLEKENTMFSGDAFGTFGSLEHGITDLSFKHNGSDDAFSFYEDEMIRYYSNIVGKYGLAVQAALKKLSGIEIRRICSTHGPVWERQAAEVTDLYERLSGYEARHGVCIAYGSMYGNTAEAAHSLARELTIRKIPFAIHDLGGYGELSAAIRDVFRYDTLIIGSPTYNGAVFPPVDAFMRAVCSRQVKDRRFFAFGSYTWASASVRILNEMALSQGFELMTPGTAFAQAYTPEKCNMSAIADMI